MQAESLEVLENAGFPPSQARAIVRAIEIEIAKDARATHAFVRLEKAPPDIGPQLRDLVVSLARTNERLDETLERLSTLDRR